MADAKLRDWKIWGRLKLTRTIMCSSGIWEFVAWSLDYRFCGNALNLPNLNGHSLQFIWYVLTFKIIIVSYAKIWTSVKFQTTLKHLKELTKYIVDQERDIQWAKGHIVQFYSVKDMDHLTHRGFITYVHHNADRQLTWVTCQSGAKLWFLLIPKKDKEGKRKSIKDWYQLHNQLLQDSREIPDDFKVCSVLLEPGQVLWV